MVLSHFDVGAGDNITQELVRLDSAFIEYNLYELAQALDARDKIHMYIYSIVDTKMPISEFLPGKDIWAQRLGGTDTSASTMWAGTEDDMMLEDDDQDAAPEEEEDSKDDQNEEIEMEALIMLAMQEGKPPGVNHQSNLSSTR